MLKSEIVDEGEYYRIVLVRRKKKYCQILLQAMMAAMQSKTPDDNIDEFSTGLGCGSSGHDKTPHISEVAHLSKQERRKRKRIHRLSTRKHK